MGLFQGTMVNCMVNCMCTPMVNVLAAKYVSGLTKVCLAFHSNRLV